MTAATLFIIIPAHNEESKIQDVIRQAQEYSQNIIVVDDGSRDSTAAKAKELRVIVLRHNVNLGKGAALRTGCDYAIQSGADNLIVLDGDGQHDPQEIPRFLKALSQSEIVFGYRRKPESMPFVLKLGNWCINNIFYLLFRINIKDSQCGYRAFTAEAYKKVRWDASDYYMETEMLIKAGKHKLSHSQIPIETIYADNYKGTTVLDGVKIVTSLFLWRFFR